MIKKLFAILFIYSLAFSSVAGGAVIFNEDFESIPAGEIPWSSSCQAPWNPLPTNISYNDYTTSYCSTPAMLQVKAEGLDGSRAQRSNLPPNAGGSQDQAFDMREPPNATGYDELWFRYYIKVQNPLPWDGASDLKMLRFYQGGSSNIPEFMGNCPPYNGHVWGVFGWETECSTWRQEDHNSDNFLCHLMHIKRNTGGNNGIQDYWIDNTLIIENHAVTASGLVWPDGTAFSTGGNVPGGNNTSMISVWYDNITISTTELTCGADASDLTPDPFSWDNVTGAELSTPTESGNTTSIIGMDNGVSISISGAGCEYSVDGSWYSTDTPSTIDPGQYVVLRVTSSDTHNTLKSCTFTAGTRSQVWTVTTLAYAEDPTPPRFRGASMTGGWR
jgi:hypothetical protein